MSQVPAAEAEQAAAYLEQIEAPAARDAVDAAYQQARAQSLQGQLLLGEQATNL